MHFNDKQKKIVCLVIAIVMIVPIAISAASILASL